MENHAWPIDRNMNSTPASCIYINRPYQAACDSNFGISRQRREYPSPLVFKKVTPETMHIIIPYLELEHGRTTDFTYGGLLMWVDYFQYEYCIYADTLFIKGVVEDNTAIPAFSLPLGALPLSESVGLIDQWCRHHNIATTFSAIPEHAVADMLALEPKSVKELTDWGDYLYDIQSLSTLAGKKLAKKRNHLHRFAEECPGSSVELITAANVKDAESFMNIYDAEGDGAAMEITESRLTRAMLRLYHTGSQLMQGMLMRDASGKTIAFTLGDVKGDTLYVHIEKADRNVPGCYEAVNQAFVKLMLNRYPALLYVNREDDGGDPGLRQAKQSYRPIEILPKYNIIF